jgi:hypothetical protein
MDNKSLSLLIKHEKRRELIADVTCMLVVDTLTIISLVITSKSKLVGLLMKSTVHLPVQYR